MEQSTAPFEALDAAGLVSRLDPVQVIAIMRSVSAELDLDRLVDAVVTSAVRHVHATHALVALPHGDTWIVAAAATARPDGIVGDHDRLEPHATVANLVDRVFGTRTMACGDDAFGARRVAMPLVRGELLGVLLVELSPARAADSLPLVELLASQAAVSLAHARRYRQSDDENQARRRTAEENERVQVALQESEARFRQMADTTPDVIWITELDPERVVYASPSFERIWGRTVEDLYAHPHLWIEGIHADDRERIGTAFVAWIRDGSRQPWEAEFRVLHPDGGVRWIHERGMFLGAEGSRRVSGISTDITERRLAEAALRESERRYSLAMESANDGHWDWIAETDEFYASPRMLEIYGFPPATQFAGRQDFLDRFPFYPEDKPRWQAAVTEHFAGRTARFDMELRMLREGEVRWIHTTGLVTRDHGGRPRRYTGSVSDITVRKASEAALRESEQRFALVVAGSTDGIWDWDVTADRMFLSDQAQRLCGLAARPDLRSPAEWMAMITLHPDDAHLQAELVDGYLQGRIPTFDGEWRVRQPDGSFRWVRLRGTGVRDTRGRLTRMAGSVNDVDFRHRAEAALQQAQRLEALGTLAGGIAHDFNNILGAILGFGEMAVRDSRPGSRVRRDIESILTAGERGRYLVERILAFSRTGVGERVPVHVEAVVQEAVDLISAGLSGHIRIDLELDGGLAATVGDSTQLHQVVINLAINAIQAMADGGGVLGVRLERVRLDQPRLVSTGKVASGDHLVLTVRDSGTGIAPDVLGRIFDPFFTTKEVGTGTGLGLALVHGIVAEVGGAIDVATTVGSGSAFRVYLPHVGDAVVARKPDPVLERGRHQEVLLVDDEEALVRLTTDTLLDLGYRPFGTGSAAEALATFEAQPQRFSAVITDERMPGLSGAELIVALRAIRPTIPIVMVSGYLGAGIDRRARQAGADAVLRKPLAKADLAGALARVLATRAATATRP